MNTDIRDKFLNFFKSKGHQIYESMPLVPDDASLLFTNAGMVQFKDIFTGKIPTPTTQRATSAQLCIRAGGKHNDLENVGYTARHHTLFEMLGNFSFGDYFKKDAIAYAWEFVTKELGFSKDVLYVTVHQDDDEAFNLWSEHIDIDRIKKMGDKDNFWQMGDTGPCGPCSEIFVDQGEEFFHSQEDYFGGDGDRFLEIWNLVFMQYERSADGKLHPLPKPSIDTGMGLERVQALLEGKRSNFDSSIFMPLIQEVCKITNQAYSYESGASFRVIADHARAVAFLLAQGVNFDKEGRGYVLRRILRRAVRHGYLLGLNQPFLYHIVEKVCDQMGGHYHYLTQKKQAISQQCKNEETRFFETIESGMEMFKKELESLPKNTPFSGEVAFKLYDTYGFPLDLTQDMLRDKKIAIDMEKFESCMQEQKKRAKASWKGSGDEIKNGDFIELLNRFGSNQFNGYEYSNFSSKVLALLDENYKEVKELNNSGYILFETTPLYPESGGAIGDRGELYRGEKKIADVLDTKKYFGLNISQIHALDTIKVNEILDIVVSSLRDEISKHHSATHLLHASLRKILGSHVSQAGSLVEATRLRFDFSHPKALSTEELEIIQEEVNRLILKGIETKTELLPIQEAKSKGAMALFGEKYGDIVRVISFDEDSCEFCGGIHIKNTANIGSFYITKESGVSSGVRRIEAVCGRAGYEWGKNALKTLENARGVLKNQDIDAGILKLKEQIKELKEKISKSSSVVDLKPIEQIKGVNIIIEKIQSGNIKEIIDIAKNNNDKIAILLLQEEYGKISLACGVKNAPLKAGEWIKGVANIMQGQGGGRDDFATAAGKDIDKIKEALKFAQDFAREKIEERD
ncbi:alanine--tRNA ligase [Helicobacter cappadocius]|uniref:Alanine--tRNA ligase n=1 Tax=Helicobacter cappadocius TaxID=3063998 RepID=A0AA90Q1A6_9HELI|nr:MULTISPECIES: alanine--tRNA ligase [unclassified Helicobacter]MDO7252451.1 alanine--tRNA ligase [Helicobacter sp. faydin-H75]MDP2538318.1 alanine--tRNA ligase [Helicobacter sp. faydin-H76]